MSSKLNIIFKIFLFFAYFKGVCVFKDKSKLALTNSESPSKDQNRRSSIQSWHRMKQLR